MKKKPLETTTYGIAELASAFGCDVRLLKRRLNDAGHGALTSWTVRQCHDALSGDGSLESLRAAKTNATITLDEIAKLDLETKRGSLVDMEDFCRSVEPIAVAMVATIESSRLTDLEKHKLREDIAKLLAVSTPPDTKEAK